MPTKISETTEMLDKGWAKSFQNQAMKAAPHPTLGLRPRLVEAAHARRFAYALTSVY
jgi:hypothetical protein